MKHDILKTIIDKFNSLDNLLADTLGEELWDWICIIGFSCLVFIGLPTFVFLVLHMLLSFNDYVALIISLGVFGWLLWPILFGRD